MNSPAVDSWFERLSMAEGKQHLPSFFTSLTAAPHNRKRKAEETLKRQANQDLENYQALEPRSLEPFLRGYLVDMPHGRGAAPGSSAKKRKTDSEEFSEAQSLASYAAASWTPDPTRPSSSSRPTSSRPTARNQELVLYHLQHALPAITGHSLEQVPSHALALHQYLQGASNPPCLPSSLKTIIQSHPVHKEATIAGCQWEEPGTPPIFDLDADTLRNTAKEVQAILDRSNDNHIQDVNEDMWCKSVVLPVLELALKMSGGSSTCGCHWDWLSVQTMNVDRELLPTLDSSKIDKKVDFTLTLRSHSDPAIAKIRERMGYKEGHGQFPPKLSHLATTDSLSNNMPLFSCVEVKRASADGYEAEVQCCVWSAASVNKKHQLQSQMIPHSSLELPNANYRLPGPTAIVTGLTRARTATDSSVQLQPRTLERDPMEVENPIAHSTPRPDSVTLSNPATPNPGSAKPRPIVEQFDPEIHITVVGSLWKFFIIYHDINHVQASWNPPIGKSPVGFVGPVAMASTTNMFELFKLLKILVAMIAYEDNVLKTLTGERKDGATVGLVKQQRVGE